MEIRELELMEEVAHTAAVELLKIVCPAGWSEMSREQGEQVREALHLVCACLAMNPSVFGDERSARLFGEFNEVRWIDARRPMSVYVAIDMLQQMKSFVHEQIRREYTAD